MSQAFIVAQQGEIKKTDFNFTANKTATSIQHGDLYPDTRKEQMAMNFHIKNRKKFTHLYELEKHFR